MPFLKHGWLSLDPNKSQLICVNTNNKAYNMIQNNISWHMKIARSWPMVLLMSLTWWIWKNLMSQNCSIIWRGDTLTTLSSLIVVLLFVFRANFSHHKSLCFYWTSFQWPNTVRVSSICLYGYTRIQESITSHLRTCCLLSLATLWEYAKSINCHIWWIWCR